MEGRPRRPGEEEETEKVEADNNDDAVQQEWDAWRAQRHAIIHTVEVSPKFSALAQKNVCGFRRGMYAGNIDFYVGHVENWITQQTEQRRVASRRSIDPFLSYAILDMPSAHLRIPHVAPILKRDGRLVVFMPSITQIGDCVELIRRQRLPFVQERVVELGAGLTSGRVWDMRFAFKKSGADPSSWAASSPEDAADTDEELPGDNTDDTHTPVEAPSLEEPSKEADAVLVCRPKVGMRTFGGGFVGVWRRIEDVPKP